MAYAVDESERLTRITGEGEVFDLCLRRSDLRAFDANRLHAELVALHRPGLPTRIVLSMNGLEVLSGPCLRTLKEVADDLSRLGGRLVLTDVPSSAARMIKRCGLAKDLRLARSDRHARRLASGGRSTRFKRAA